MRHFLAVVEKTKTDFGVFFPDIPNLVSAGSSIDAAMRTAQVNLKDHLTGLMQNGVQVPFATPISQIDMGPSSNEVARFLIRFDISSFYQV